MKNQLLKFISYLFILFGNDLFSQLPSELNHPSNIILKRLSAYGLLNLDYFGKNNLSATTTAIKRTTGKQNFF